MASKAVTKGHHTKKAGVDAKLTRLRRQNRGLLRVIDGIWSLVMDARSERSNAISAVCEVISTALPEKYTYFEEDASGDTSHDTAVLFTGAGDQVIRIVAAEMV